MRSIFQQVVSSTPTDNRVVVGVPQTIVQISAIISLTAHPGRATTAVEHTADALHAAPAAINGPIHDPTECTPNDKLHYRPRWLVSAYLDYIRSTAIRRGVYLYCT